MKILVTGGAGFIGSHLVDALVIAGHEVVVIDDLSTGHKQNLNPNAKLIELNVAAPKVRRVFDREQPEAVFHLAAQINIHRSMANPLWDAEQNIIGTLNLLENSQRLGVKKIIFSSSAAVYGDNGVVPTTEDSPLLAPSPYGIGKLAGEKYLEYYYQTSQLPFVTLRYANVYGPRQSWRGEGGVVAIFTARAVVGKRLVINGDGSQTRDFVFVGDVVQANLKALATAQVGIYNIGTAIETSIAELAKKIIAAAQSPVTVTYNPARPVDQQRSALDHSKATQELGFVPTIDLETGIQKTITWFKSQK